MMRKPLSFIRKPLVVAITSASALLVTAVPANAVDLDFGEDSELSGKLDVTLGYATSFRAQDKDADPSALGNNELSELRVPDKGDQISQVFSTTLELGLDWRNYGLVASGKYQYDTEIMNGDSIDPLDTVLLGGAGTGASAPWSDAAEDYAGNTFDVLDAYVYGAFEVGENPLEVRIGKQVINWGEGLYFLDGASTQVPLNFNKLVTPGSELKEAYIGNNSVYAQMGLGESSSVEAYVHTEWNRTELPPQGTFYGYDWLFRGSDEPVTGTGALGYGKDVGYSEADKEADDSGQWGISGRTSFGDTEYGLYYSRYHETLAFYESTSCAESLFCTRRIWPEDINMFGASFSTTAGTVALAGEVAYRPNRPLMSNLFSTTGGLGVMGAPLGDTSIEEHDTINASVNAIWLGGAAPLGVDSQVAIAQVGIDHISGDTSNLHGQSSITRQKNDHSAQTTKSADNTAYGVAVQWIGTWQAALPATDISLDLFLQHDIDGVSHFYGNFAEGRTLASATVTANIGNELEASMGYAMTDHEESDYEDLDTFNLSVNYKF